MFISVDLPAPFSPRSAWISPGARRGRCGRSRAPRVALRDSPHLERRSGAVADSRSSVPSRRGGGPKRRARRTRLPASRPQRYVGSEAGIRLARAWIEPSAAIGRSVVEQACSSVGQQVRMVGTATRRPSADPRRRRGGRSADGRPVGDALDGLLDRVRELLLRAGDDAVRSGSASAWSTSTPMP